MPTNLENSAVARRLKKFSFHSNPKERQCTIALISHASKVMLRVRLQQYVNWELPDVQAGFRKGRGTRDQIANSHWISEKSKRISEKYLLLLYWLCQSLWLCGSQQNVKFLLNFLQEMGIPDYLTCLPRNLYAGQEATVRTRHETMDWFQIGKGAHQCCILSPCLFNLDAEYVTWNLKKEFTNCRSKKEGK